MTDESEGPVGSTGISRALNEKKPAKVDDDKWEEMQAQVCATIRLCLTDQIMYHVMDEISPKKIWDKLEEQFMSKTLTRKLYLKQKLYGLKMQEGSDITEHINVFNQLIADLGKVEVKIDEEDRVIILLCSLLGSYEHLVTILTLARSMLTWMELLLLYLVMSKGERIIYLKILLEVLL